MEIKNIISKLADEKDLTIFEAETLLEAMADGEMTQAQIASVLTSLRIKGESVEEILGFINIMRKHMIKIDVPGDPIDTCGTGGDKSGTFNISTAVAFVVAGCGVKVAKHGNRAASSQCGSADVLEALGIDIHLAPNQAGKHLQKNNFAFLFAPLYHPAMKYVVPVRRELGIRTIFNFLGPFLNPAGVKRQMVGVPNKKVAEKLANVATSLNYEHLLIVTGEDGLDEISTSGKTCGFQIKGKKINTLYIDPQEFGIDAAKKSDVTGGTVFENKKIILDILHGKKGPKRDIVLFNSAFALFVSGQAQTVGDGITMAQTSIDVGKALNVLKESL